MAIRTKPVDVALVGGGLTACILGKELAEAGYSVVAPVLATDIDRRCSRLLFTQDRDDLLFAESARLHGPSPHKVMDSTHSWRS